MVVGPCQRSPEYVSTLDLLLIVTCCQPSRHTDLSEMMPIPNDPTVKPAMNAMVACVRCNFFLQTRFSYKKRETFQILSG